MSLATQKATQRLISIYSRDQEKFISQIVCFNPEPQIIEFSTRFSDLPEYRLSRVIKWQEVRSNFNETNPLFTADFTNILGSLLENISLGNLHEYLRPDYRLDGDLFAFRITEVNWLIHLWSTRWSFAPPYAPKRLYGGIKINLTADNLSVYTQDISKTIWCNYEINTTRIIPLTAENFEKVLDFHATLATVSSPKEKNAHFPIIND